MRERRDLAALGELRQQRLSTLLLSPGGLRERRVGLQYLALWLEGIALLAIFIWDGFRLSDHIQLEALMEFFNILNRANPRQVQGTADATVPFGKVTQALPGREGQVAIKIEF